MISSFLRILQRWKSYFTLFALSVIMSSWMLIYFMCFNPLQSLNFLIFKLFSLSSGSPTGWLPSLCHAFWYESSVQILLAQSLPRAGISHFFKDAWYLWWEMCSEDSMWGLELLIATGVVTVSCPCQYMETVNLYYIFKRIYIIGFHPGLLLCPLIDKNVCHLLF